MVKLIKRNIEISNLPFGFFFLPYKWRNLFITNVFYFVLNEETLTRLNLPVYFLTPNGLIMGLDSLIIPHHSRPSQCLRFAMALGGHVLFLLRTWHHIETMFKT